MIRVRGMFQKDLHNRSSKHLLKLTGYKSVVRCMNNAQLDEAIKNGVDGAAKEQKRRETKRAKKAK